MDDKSLFNEFQSGFRKHRSCEDHIIRLEDVNLKSISKNGYNLAVPLDKEKAFGRMWLDGLLYKIKKLEFNGHIYE